MVNRSIRGLALPLMFIAVSTQADDAALAEMARKAQGPLGDVKAIMTDNTIAFDGGEDGDDTSYGFQIQPVYAIKNDTSFNMIARAVIPIVEYGDSLLNRRFRAGLTFGQTCAWRIVNFPLESAS
jgi:hypothetical protein